MWKNGLPEATAQVESYAFWWSSENIKTPLNCKGTNAIYVSLNMLSKIVGKNIFDWKLLITLNGSTGRQKTLKIDGNDPSLCFH